jgi:hypothetical protein
MVLSRNECGGSSAAFVIIKFFSLSMSPVCWLLQSNLPTTQIGVNVRAVETVRFNRLRAGPE